MDVISMNNRTAIWESVFQILSIPRIEHLWGYGFRGQVSSGIVDGFWLALSNQYDTIVSAHNFLLQTILDIGYLGILIALFLISNLLAILSAAYQKSDDYTIKVFVFAIVYFLFIGATEIAFSPDIQEVFIIFFLIVISALKNEKIIKIKAIPQKLQGIA